MKVRHVYESFIPKRLGVIAITLYPFIFYSIDESRARESGTYDHELVHVSQVRRVGWVSFYLSYLLFYFAFRLHGKNDYDAYMSIPWEVEAYEHQDKVLANRG